jgi:2-aminoethylphosphonate-pyruvate transaminase
MTGRRILLTPGPLTTDPRTRQAMADDWGSREASFIALTAELRRRLLAVVQAGEDFTAVPLQGSGTFIVEAALGALVGPSDKLLVLANGAYGERMVQIAQRQGREVAALRWPEDAPVDPEHLDRALRDAPQVTHVAFVHCETTTGLLNPLDEIAEVVARAGRRLIVDAMSSFGALPIDLARTPVSALLASSNKCLEGVPGLGFSVVRTADLAASAGRSPSVSLDLHDQWRGLETNGQWRFTPPVQVVAALVEALRLLEAEGGPTARRARYAENFRLLIEGMASMGFEPYLSSRLQSGIIATFRTPRDRPFDFNGFYQALAENGFVIYPGKLSREETFRIGCIGAIGADDIRRLLAAVAAVSPAT